MKITEKEFEQLVAKHKSTIYSVCYMFSNDADEVSDLFQEVLINVWRGLNDFEERSKLSTWIWRISLNTCIGYDRKRKRNNEARLKMEVDMFDTNEKDAELAQQLRSRIQRLQPFDRAIVLLWLENISYEEIGEIVGISTQNVSVRLVRIRQQLRQMK